MIFLSQGLPGYWHLPKLPRAEVIAEVPIRHNSSGGPFCILEPKMYLPGLTFMNSEKTLIDSHGYHVWQPEDPPGYILILKCLIVLVYWILQPSNKDAIIISILWELRFGSPHWVKKKKNSTSKKLLAKSKGLGVWDGCQCRKLPLITNLAFMTPVMTLAAVVLWWIIISPFSLLHYLKSTVGW